MECSGEIGIISGASKVRPGDRVTLTFSPAGSASPPFGLKVVSPSGATLIDVVLRELPTPEPQTPPPVEFVASAAGRYRIDIRELRGSRRGEGTLVVA